MEAKQLLKNDLRIKSEIANSVIDKLNSIIDILKDGKELNELINNACGNSFVQYVFFHGLSNITQSANEQLRSGASSLADRILDQQWAKVKRYKEKAHPLTERQCDVIIRQFLPYIKPELIRNY
jgi:hypothetical protein